jgi:hypothetical protein
MACGPVARAALLRFDRDRASALAEVQRELATGVEDEDAALWLDATTAWIELWSGGADVAPRIDALRQRAADRAEPWLVVESTALSALAALPDLEQALQVARRASRMAASEGLPAPEYLANMVLARLRRLCGTPHLAARILAGLERVVPEPWRGWLACEAFFASGSEAAADALERVPASDAATTAARALVSAEEAARQGRRDRFEPSLREAAERAAGFEAVASEVRTLGRLIDYAADLTEAEGSVRVWCAGEDDAVPPAARGVCRPEGTAGSGESALAWAFVEQGRSPRRIARPGVPLLLAEREALALRQTKRKSGRTDKALAALALAGPAGLDETELFRAAYGFAFSAALHQDVLRVLLHRTRGRLGDGGELTHRSGRVTLVPRAPLVVPDPRCGQPVDDRVLRWLARRGHATAQEVAAECGVSLRAAQATLQQLTSEGACQPERKGRRVEYKVEDTTYSEPTQY